MSINYSQKMKNDKKNHLWLYMMMIVWNSSTFLYNIERMFTNGSLTLQCLNDTGSWGVSWPGKIFFFFFFSTQLYFTIFTFLFVTTRQSSTYKQSITDFKVRILVCIRTLVTSESTHTPNNAPKATGNGLIQYGTIITRSIFLNFSQQITHSLPVRARNGCLLWVSSLIYALLQVQCCV